MGRQDSGQDEGFAKKGLFSEKKSQEMPQKKGNLKLCGGGKKKCLPGI